MRPGANSSARTHFVEVLDLALPRLISHCVCSLDGALEEALYGVFKQVADEG